ncbi:DUF742 domain-containing protein [Streptomyces sp. BR123]|uniref:DUF742 domain-containing protein n=1 Tax=Streptomyces sp. BR123 TaxID=2749828 RepID=UPI002811E636|nr:DUF742 domain-containing protein [Streptomyces sp. BR123]
MTDTATDGEPIDLSDPSDPSEPEEPEEPAEPGEPPRERRPRGRRRTRLYALTDGRTDASCTVLTMDTTITAAVSEEAWSGLPSEWRAVLAMCVPPDGRAVAEIAARMHIRLTPMTMLLGELTDRGLIHHQPPLEGAETTNVHLLMRIRDNLARI